MFHRGSANRYRDLCNRLPKRADGTLDLPEDFERVLRAVAIEIDDSLGVAIDAAVDDLRTRVHSLEGRLDLQVKINADLLRQLGDLRGPQPKKRRRRAA